MKMFGVKTVLAAGALALLGSQAGAVTTTLDCPVPVDGDAVSRYLHLEWTGDQSLVTCLDHGASYTGNIFTDNNLGYVFIDETEDADKIDLGLSGYLQAANSSLFGGTSGTLEFDNPGTHDLYAILLKFGNNHVPESWFAFELDLGGLDFLSIGWSIFFDAGFEANEEGWELSHTGIYGKDVPQVPLPAGGLLLLTALGGMALVRRRKLVAA